MEFKSEEAKKDWEHQVKINDDPYSSAIISYAKDWAKLMEKKMSKGKNLEDIAEKSSHDADTDGITGFMYGCTALILSKIWIHGERLRKWHNLKTQIGNEGEKANESGKVLNPAVLNIG